MLLHNHLAIPEEFIWIFVFAGLYAEYSVSHGDHPREKNEHESSRSRDRGTTTGGRADKRRESNPRHIPVTLSRGIYDARDVLRLKKFRGGAARTRSRGSRSPARSGSNPLTAGVAPFPPATTRQPLTRRLSPGPRAVDLPSPTYPPNHPAPAPPTLLLPSPPPSPSRNRRSSRRCLLPWWCWPAAHPSWNFPTFWFPAPFFFSYTFSLYFRRLSKSCEYRFPMSPYGTKIEG